MRPQVLGITAADLNKLETSKPLVAAGALREGWYNDWVVFLILDVSNFIINFIGIRVTLKVI
jgi:hypothetical protein